ncbi:hypothetical protein [Streptomyces sp. NRRL S-1813]|uniref:hypothetical protein n=1 Tax=Streptomyces sp. NRRL S-1813 TaxID=1463888 RepID=UPI0004C87487|nr:hypothetical protein [Streptomyces sp. NRRL S-1813]
MATSLDLPILRLECVGGGEEVIVSTTCAGRIGDVSTAEGADQDGDVSRVHSRACEHAHRG